MTKVNNERPIEFAPNAYSYRGWVLENARKGEWRAWKRLPGGDRISFPNARGMATQISLINEYEDDRR